MAFFIGGTAPAILERAFRPLIPISIPAIKQRQMNSHHVRRALILVNAAGFLASLGMGLVGVVLTSFHVATIEQIVWPGTILKAILVFSLKSSEGIAPC